MSTNRFETSDSLPAYFKRLDKLQKALTKDEERALAARIQAGGRDGDLALNSLVEANLKFVVTMANKFIGLGLPIDDLIQEANIGLIIAAQKFKPDSTVKFITYAQFHVRKRLNLSLCEHGRTVRLPVNQEYDLYKKRMAGESYNLSNVEIDKPVGEDEDGTLGDLILYTDPESRLEKQEELAYLNRLLSKLKDQDREIVELFYGIVSDRPDGKGLSTKEIAELVEKTVPEVNRSLKVSRHKLRLEVSGKR
jgi:RNA polymerase primary sigma factor